MNNISELKKVAKLQLTYLCRLIDIWKNGWTFKIDGYYTTASSQCWAFITKNKTEGIIF